MTTTTPKTSYLFIVTHYDSDADRAATPLVLANNALAAGATCCSGSPPMARSSARKAQPMDWLRRAFRQPPICSRASRRVADASASARRAAKRTA